MSNALADVVGPFYDTSGTATSLSVSEAIVRERLKSGDLLGCETSDGMTLYPVFQFTEGQVNPALAPAIRILSSSPHWSAALWFVTPNDELDDLTPLDWGQAGQPTEAITRAAGHIAGVWAA